MRQSRHGCLGLSSWDPSEFYSAGKPVENGFIESFNGRLRDECLNVEVFFTLEDVREKLTRWQQDYNLARPHSTLQDQAPACFEADWCAATRIIQESHELLDPLTVSKARFATPHRRPKPITQRPIPQLPTGLVSRGGSSAGILIPDPTSFIGDRST